MATGRHTLPGPCIGPLCLGNEAAVGVTRTFNRRGLMPDLLQFASRFQFQDPRQPSSSGGVTRASLGMAKHYL